MTVVEQDFGAYAAARWSSLVRSAVFLGCSVEEAQDLAQVTLLRCYVAWARVQRADDRDAYVYRVLLNCLRDSRRRRWWGERPTERLPEAPSRDGANDVDVADAVHRAMGGLSKAHREVVVLRIFADLSEQQTASALGVEIGTVKSRLARALARLAADTHLLDLTEGPAR
ncbi:MAG: SigE family RNA polymerase sigma factor [Actinomycetota bacterium]|nr:SigE family RNA polymerase sigma factor [Actinomycetota bacterium]MDQ3424107.1 SigE family RNA polymerase sigma factor [Actinomycetota bacterium]